MSISHVMLRRVLALTLLLLVIVAGLVVHGLLPDADATDIAGDALYAVAAYLLVVVLAPRLPPLAVGAIAAVWCIGIELFQLTGLPARTAAVFPPAVLVLGTVFDGRDLLIYAIATVAATLADAAGARFIGGGRSAAAPER